MGPLWRDVSSTGDAPCYKGLNPTKRAEDSDLAPRVILQQALRLFKKQALGAISIEQVAAAAGARSIAAVPKVPDL